MDIIIKAVKFRQNGFYTQPFVFGGVAFEELLEEWKCPRCKQSKEKFNKA